MLAADKLQLQSSLKQQATALKEKEFNLHHSNLMTVGTQAAVLAGLDITMFIEFQPPHDSEWQHLSHVSRSIKFFYYIIIVAAFCCNILVVAQSTALSVLGSSLALRGPDGSMIVATDGLYEERKSVFVAFAYGLGCTVVSVCLAVWLILSPEAAMMCMSVTMFTCLRMYKSYLRVNSKFFFNEDDTVDFTDIFEGPAAIRAVPSKSRPWLRSRESSVSAKGGRGSAIKTKTSSPNSDDSDISSSSVGETDRMIPDGRWGPPNGGSTHRGRTAGRPRKRSPSSVSASSKKSGSNSNHRRNEWDGSDYEYDGGGGGSKFDIESGTARGRRAGSNLQTV